MVVCLVVMVVMGWSLGFTAVMGWSLGFTAVMGWSSENTMIRCLVYGKVRRSSGREMFAG